uniref:Uncharacterized protein n=1 Tax=Thermus islandicus TaxID=540988 RepID=A0A7C2FW62_9DEIN
MWFFRKDPHVRPDGPLAFRVRVRTRSGEVVELRLSKSAEISPTEAGFYVRKEIVAPRSLDRAVLEIWFDRRFRPVRKEVQGGELLPWG